MSHRQELIDTLSTAVRAYQRSTDALDDAVAGRFGINRTDLRCLDWLFDGPVTAGHLADATGLSSAAMTALLDRLEAKGLVRRVRATTDRRKVLVEVTGLSRQIASQLYGPLVAEGAALLEAHTEVELELLAEYFAKTRALTDNHCARIRQLPPDTD